LKREVIKGHVAWFDSKDREVLLPPQYLESSNLYRRERRVNAWKIISTANIPAKEWSLDQSTKEVFIRQKGKFIGAEIPNKFGAYMMIQLPEENEWAYFVAMMDNLLGEDRWMAVINPGYGPTPWINAARSPSKNQRIRLFFLEEQLLREQLQKLEERYNPAPFIWDCPSEEQEEEDLEDFEDMNEDSPEASPLLPAKVKKEIKIPTINWSQMPWFKLEEALEDLPKANPVRKKKRKKIPFILSLSDAYNLGMGGTLVPLQLMLIWGIRTPLSQSDLLLKAAEAKIEERRQRTERLNNAKSVLFAWLNSDQYKKTRWHSILFIIHSDVGTTPD
jgi:hypothetical protein